jgi:large subunit ribosomal protein L31
MKKEIHPTYYPAAQIKCACGNVIVVGSTMSELATELCSACHPFYTGKQKLVDTARRVEKFKAKATATAALKSVRGKTAKRAAKAVKAVAKKAKAKK